MIWCVSYDLGAFGTVKLPYETQGKTFRTSAKVRATMLRGIISQRRTRSTLLDPKLMFWCVPYHFGVFGTIWLPYETQGKTFRTSAKVRAMKSHRNFPQQKHPIPHWTLNSCFGAFRTIWDS